MKFLAGRSAARSGLSIFLLATVVACSGDPTAVAPPADVVVARVDAAVGRGPKAGDPGAGRRPGEEQGLLRCGRDGEGCKAIGSGQRVEWDSQLKTTRGARASLTIRAQGAAAAPGATAAGVTLDLDEEASIALSGHEAGMVRVDRGVVTLDAPVLAGGGAGASLAAPRLRVVDRVAEVDPLVPTIVAVRVSDADRASISVLKGHVTLRGEPGADDSTEAAELGAPFELRAGESALVKLGEAPDGRATFRGQAAPIALHPRDDASGEQDRGATPRGLGTMTARVPGTSEVISGVRLASHRATVVVRDGYARTEIEEVFQNDTSRVLEGRFVFPLPPNASISRLALWVGNELVEGEIVERETAARIFKGIVDDTVRPRDPALLEWISGGEFSLKIFPIPAKSSRKVVLAYNQVLPTTGGRVRYAYPLSLGADRTTTIDDFSIDVTATDSTKALHDVSTPRYPATIATEEGRIKVGFSARAFRPTADFVVSYERDAQPGAQLATYTAKPGEFQGAEPRAAGAEPPRAQTYAAVRMTVDLPDGAPMPAYVRRDRALIVDSSFSQSRETLAGAAALTMGLIRAMDPDERFVVLACDSACVTYPEDGLGAPAEAPLEELERWLAARSPGGSSDVAGALVAAARRLPQGGSSQIVFLGDGAPSSGELSVETIAARVRPALEQGRVDLRLLGAGRTVDEVVLEGLARALGGAYERVTTGDSIAQRTQAIAQGLRRPVVQSPAIELPEGFEDVHPKSLPNLRLGEEVVLVGKVTGDLASKTVKIRGKLGGEPYELASTIGAPSGGGSGGGEGRTAGHEPNPLVPRLWAEARIDELASSSSKEAAGQIIAISKGFHVMARSTAMLVLENDRMFREFGIKRTTKHADDHSDHAFGAPRQSEGLAKALRSDPGSSKSPWGADDAGSLTTKGSLWGDQIGEAFGRGGLGLSGVGEGGGGKGDGGIGLGKVGSVGHGAGEGSPAGGTGQGFGSGSGRLGGSHRSSSPKIRMGMTSVSGRLPPEIIQRIVRQNFGRFRFCYERGLMRKPDLQGRVAVRFLIGRDGAVSSAANGGSDLPDAEVVTCVVNSFRALSFPQPEGGVVTVVYPIVFSSDGSQSPRPPSPWPTPPPVVTPWIGAGPDASSGTPDRWAPKAVHRAADDTWMTAGEPALEKLRKAVEESTASRAKHEAWVTGLLARGRFQQALAAAERFTELDPDLARDRELYAYARAATGDGEGAVRALDALVEASPRSSTSHARAARAFEAVGDERRACAHWRSLAELRASEEATHEALRCRARAWGDREAVLQEARTLSVPARAAGRDAPTIARLVERLEAGAPPAYEGSAASPGQFEAKITCGAGVERCPTLLVVTQSGTVLSPWTPAVTRSSAGAISFSGLKDGTYRTLVVGGAADTRAEVEVRALGASKKFSIQKGGQQTVAASTVSNMSQTF